MKDMAVFSALTTSRFRRFFVSVFALLLVVMIPGCRSSPSSSRNDPSETMMPFTISLMQRLKDTDVREFQFILFGRITLEREYVEVSASRGRGGRADLENSYIKDIITIRDQLEGQVLNVFPSSLDLNNITRYDEVVLSVGFENTESLYLDFSSRTDDPTSFFYLNYSRLDAYSSSADDIKGTLDYGDGSVYKLKFNMEKAPYLLIRLSQRDIERLNPHEAPGRRVNR